MVAERAAGGRGGSRRCARITGRHCACGVASLLSCRSMSRYPGRSRVAPPSSRSRAVPSASKRGKESARRQHCQHNGRIDDRHGCSGLLLRWNTALAASEASASVGLSRQIQRRPADTRRRLSYRRKVAIEPPENPEPFDGPLPHKSVPDRGHRLMICLAALCTVDSSSRCCF